MGGFLFSDNPWLFREVETNIPLRYLDSISGTYRTKVKYFGKKESYFSYAEGGEVVISEI
jgi:hypothetical protein